MAKDNKIRMPSSGAGITQYWDSVKTNIELTPGQVIGICAIIIIVMILLHLYGGALFGLN